MEVGPEEEEQSVQKEEESESPTSDKFVTTPVMAPSGIKGHRKTQARSTEEVGPPSWSTIYILKLQTNATVGKININSHTSPLRQCISEFSVC